MLILMGQFQNCATADILIERQTGGQGAQDYLIAGAKIQGHATLRGIEIDGAANVAMRSLYFEIGSNVSLTMATYDSGTGKATVTTSGSHAFRVNQVVHVEGIQNPPMGDYNGKFIITAVGTDPAQPTTFSYAPVNAPSGAGTTGSTSLAYLVDAVCVRVRPATAGTAAGDWAQAIGAEACTLQGFGGGADYGSGNAKHFDVNNCHNFNARNNFHEGAPANISSANPICHLRGSTKACRVDFEVVADFNDVGTKVGTMANIINNEGTGSYGVWWNPGLSAYKYWTPSTPPS